MPPSRAVVKLAKSMRNQTCIIAARISLEATDEPNSEALADAPKPRAFSASELVQCGACGRANPPTRGSCMYCGAALEITELNAFASAPVQETDASAEVCFHVVAMPTAQIEDAAIDKLAALLKIKPSELKSLFAHSSGAPVFAANSEKQAQLAAERLREQGIGTRVISDEEIDVYNPPAAISGLELRDADIVGRVGRGNQAVAASWDEISLVVSGRLYFETREIEQKRSRAKRVIDEREMVTDEAVLDIYPRADTRGWRIRAANFDFSCLGDSKGLTTFENFASLRSWLTQHATRALFDDSYLRVRRALDSIWPSEPGARAKDRRSNVFGDFESSATSTNNEVQFTRYSRLLRQLLASNSGDHA